MNRVIIAGGGVSGIYAAILLKSQFRSMQIEIIEQNDAPLKKLLVTGSGRCNLSNKNIDLARYDTDHKKLTDSIIHDFDDQKEFRKLGLYTKYLGDLLYPVSEQAKSVRNVLMDRINDLNIPIHLNESITDISHPDEYLVETDQNTYHCDILILSMGSPASQISGDEDRQPILSHLHLPFRQMTPMLVAMNTKPAYKPLKGLRMKGHFSLQYHNHILSEEKGEILFTDYGVSGIAVMQLSRFYKKGAVLHADLLPEVSVSQFRKLINSSCSHPLDGLLPTQMVKLIERKKMDPVRFIKDFQVEVTGLRDMKYAQAAKGGLSMKGFNENLESLYEKNLFACGELLNTTGDCGGFNLHFAFSSAKRVVRGIERKYNVKNK